DAHLTKNVDATGERSVCSLVHREKVQCPSATELWDTVWKGTTGPTDCSGLDSGDTASNAQECGRGYDPPDQTNGEEPAGAGNRRWECQSELPLSLKEKVF
ncbi:hypothetical protein AVEN_54189-1, partial [Araneus ventricosus]